VSHFLPIPARDFTNLPSWANNCVANEITNGVDRKLSGGALRSRAVHVAPIFYSGIVVEVPYTFKSTLSAINRTIGGLESHILPRNRTGVVRVLRCRPVPYILNH